MNDMKHEIDEYLQALKTNISLACMSFNTDIRPEETEVILKSFNDIYTKFQAGNYCKFQTEVVNLYDYLFKTSDAFSYCCALLEAIRIRIPELASTVIKETLPN